MSDIDDCDNNTSSHEQEDEEEYEYDYSDEDEFMDQQQQQTGDDDASMADLDEDERGNSENNTKTHNKKPRSSSTELTSDNPNAAPVKGFYGREEADYGEGSSSLQGGINQVEGIRMLESAELMPVMKRRIREVTEVLSIPESAAGVLMREHKWAKERLFEIFYTDPEALLDKYGVRCRCEAPIAAAPVAAPAGRMTRNRLAKLKASRECPICFMDDLDPADMFCMPCGHSFCRDCWYGFIQCKIGDGPSCVRESCPQTDCKEALTEEEVGTLAPDLLPKFEEYQLRSFVEMNGSTRWCPGPGCTKVAMESSPTFASTGFSASVAECKCGTLFCLRCGEEPHAPSTCAELGRWKEKCKNESETANWILANTKCCPKCSTRIEKNQGCNHMSCQQCKYEFCWICMGGWTDHGANTGGYYKCNKYDPTKSDDDQSDAAKAKRELDRYLHYYKRHHAHAMAQKFAEKQLKETEAKMILLQESSDNSTWADVEFLKNASEQLIECRRVLKYTYTFAYYLADGTKKKERFEHHQEMLEKFTESLSEQTELPIAEMNRTDVVNQTRVVNRFMRNILSYVEDGMEED